MAAKKGGILANKKARPWIIGGAVIVGGLVLFFMLRGGGGSSGGGAVASGPSEQLQIAQAQIGAGVAQSQMAANVETARIMAENESFRYGADTELALAQIGAQVSQYQTAAQAEISLAGIGAQTQIALGQERTAQMGIEAQQAVQIAGFGTQAAISEQQFAFLTSQEQYRAQTEQARIGADVAMNQAQQKTARKGQTLGFLGSVVGSALAFFSDVTMKKNVTWTGEAATRNPAGRGFVEYGRYEWDWSGTTFYGVGVLAQEVAGVLPGAVIEDYDRKRLAVNYGALG